MTTQKEEPRGLGGWLILPAIGLVITPLSILLTLINDYLPIFQQGYWQVLTTPGTSAYHPLWAPILTFEVAGNLVLLAFDVVLIYLFFTKSYRLPGLFIAYLVSRLIFAVADFFLAGLIPAIADQLDPMSMVQAVAVTAVWIPYFLLSKRVKSTFVAGAPSTRFQPTTDPSSEAKRHLGLAYGHEAQDRFESALRECESAIHLAPDCAEAHNLRGIILEELNRGKEAIDAYREAVRLDPSLSEARENLEEAEAQFG